MNSLEPVLLPVSKPVLPLGSSARLLWGKQRLGMVSLPRAVSGCADLCQAA